MGIDGWALVFRGQFFQADLAKAILEANGIPAQAFGDTAYGPIMQARVFVPDDRLDEAVRLLDEGLNSEDAGNYH